MVGGPGLLSTADDSGQSRLAAPADSSPEQAPGRGDRTNRSSERSELPAAAETAERATTRAEELASQRDEIADATKQAEAAAEKKRKAAAEKKAAAAKKKAAAERAKYAKLGYEKGTTDPREIAEQMMGNKYGWGGSEFSCYDKLVVSESNWDHTATNPSSGAYGIPQSLPASKMSTAGSDWRTNPATQIRWGLDYVEDVYGTPCAAWSFKQGNNWY